MGLLDDAIREHLELKRRHGADPQEVARQEDEALGPIPGREAREGEHEPELDHHEVELDHAEVEHDHEEPEPFVEPIPGQLELDEPPVPYEPPAAAAPAPDDPSFDLQQPTVEFSVADEHEPEPAPEPEPEPAPEPDLAPAPSDESAEPADELEETPEFLQETPEHDRLWFEQKPPRDFDF